MADGGEAHTLRYSAFISYSHRDAAFARSLHRRLEAYRLPRHLRRQDMLPGGFQDARQATPQDALPRRLRPIFRDRDELPAACDLSAAVREAIAQSSALIVVCSPAAVASEWVAREVAMFRRLHGDGAVLAALIAGDEATAFPAALCGAGMDGGVMQPLAADFRRDADGPRLALLKLVAVLAGVRLDALVQRDAQRRVRQITVAAGAALLGLAVMTALTWVAVTARVAAEAERNRGETLIGFMLTDLRGKLKGVGRLDLLDEVNKGALAYYRSQNLSVMTDAALQQRAMLLQAVGEDDMKRARLDDARAHFEEAERTTAALLAAHPDDAQRIFAQSQSEYWVGYVDWQVGRFAQAEEKFNAYAALVRRLLAHDATNPDWILEMGYANDDLGMLVMRVDYDLARAGQYLSEALKDFDQVARARPDDADSQAQLADAYGWVGDVARLRGDFAAANADRQRQRALLEKLLARDRRNAATRLSLVYNTLALARIEDDEGNPAQALADLDRGHDAATVLSAAEPDNVEVSDEVRVFELFKARTLMMRPGSADHAEPDIDGALDHCAMQRPSASSQELQMFCTILRARRLRQLHQITASEACLAPLLPALHGQARLSERWGLDFQAEIRLARSDDHPATGVLP